MEGDRKEGSKGDERQGKGGQGASDSPMAAPVSAAESAAFGLPFVLNYWKEFDLESERTTMDEQGLKVAEHQETSTKNRRKLAESTRDFRKASAAEQPKLFVNLLKAYQEEVDNLTKRAKFAEGAFLGLYQKLYEAPDPAPALASAAELASKLADLAQENRKMKAELDEFRAESSHLKNQQATVRRLEERNRQLEQLMEEKVKDMVSMKQQVLAEESQKSLEALKEREEALQEQLRVARGSVENMQRLHEMGQSQLFEVKAKSEEEREAKQYELNLLTDEVDRAQSRLLSLEREKEALKAQLKEVATTNSSSNNSGAQSGGDSEGSVNQHSWEAALRAKEAIVSELHAELHAVETGAANEREHHIAEVKRLHASLQEKDDEILELRSELSTRPSAKQWEDVRKQVKILQAVGYNAVEIEDWESAGPSSGTDNGGQEGGGRRGTGAGGGGGGGGGGGAGGGSGGGGAGELGRLEALLLEKNRRMEHELTQAKFQLSDRTEQAESLQESVRALEAKVEEQSRLITKLEEDILKGYNKQGEGGMMGSWGARGGFSSPFRSGSTGAATSPGKAGGGGGGEALSGLVAGVARLGIGVGASEVSPSKERGEGAGGGGEGGQGYTGAGAQSGARAGAGGGGGGGGEGRGDAGGATGDAGEDQNSVLAVVCSQRDRFRQRITDLEEELRASRDKCVRLGAEVEKLRGDNVKLYERMRYVQSYSSGGGSSGFDKGTSRTRKQATDIESVDVEQKYKKMYEEGLNPFAAFSNKERELRYKELGLRDWIALTSGRFLLSNKHARTFVFFYSIALHILVFLSMYRMSSYSHQGIKYQTSQFTEKWRHPAEKATMVLGESLSEPVRLLTEAPAILRANLTALVTGEPPSEVVEMEE